MTGLPKSSSFEQTSEAASFLKERLSADLQNPRVAIVCGSGLGRLVNSIHESPKKEFDYADIPHFPHLTVSGHAGKLVFGHLAHNVPVVLMVGRAHYYEGHSIDRVTFPIRVFKLLGIDTVVLTNAAGGLNPEYAVGDVVVINDHLFLAGLGGTHPLRGPNAEEFGPRFPPMSDAYDLELRRSMHASWSKVITPESKRRIHEGVYAYAGGPKAECRMLHMLGADVVGMSTVPEIIVARHCGIRVIALSLVTNSAVLSPVPRGNDPLIQNKSTSELDAILQEGKANHEEVLEAGRSAAMDMERFVEQAVADIYQQV